MSQDVIMIDNYDYQPSLVKCPTCGQQMLHHTHFVERYSSYTHWSDHWVTIYKCPRCGHVDNRTKVPTSNPANELNYQGRNK